MVELKHKTFGDDLRFHNLKFNLMKDYLWYSTFSFFNIPSPFFIFFMSENLVSSSIIRLRDEPRYHKYRGVKNRTKSQE